MFKSRRKVVRKCGGDRQFLDRSSSGAKKVEGNSNIANKRLTIPPGFLCLGIKSETIQKRKKQQNNYTPQDYILKEDLHGLLHSNVSQFNSKLRRSSRISKKVEQTGDEVIASHYPKLLKQHDPPETEERDSSLYDKNAILKNKSKSLFRQINKRCARIGSRSSTALDCSESPISNKIEVFQVSNFCKKLYEEVCLDLKQAKTLINLKSTIAAKIENIDQIVSGKSVPNNMMTEDTETKNNMDTDKEEIVKNFNYLPKCEWVFETPPRQRIILPKVDDCAIQPAIICTTKRQSNIYELNPSIKIDLNNYSNRQQVEVDRRYMRHLASFEDNAQIDSGLDSLTNKIVTHRRTDNMENNYCQNQNECSNAQFYLGNPFLNLPENQFMTVISRPTKSASKVLRTNNVFKRKIAELDSTPTASNVRKDDGHFEGDFTFINDDGEYKIVNTQSLADDRNFNFQFKKNLFKGCGEENLFNFANEEQKMFDFSQLKRDDC